MFILNVRPMLGLLKSFLSLEPLITLSFSSLLPSLYPSPPFHINDPLILIFDNSCCIPPLSDPPPSPPLQSILSNYYKSFEYVYFLTLIKNFDKKCDDNDDNS